MESTMNYGEMLEMIDDLVLNKEKCTQKGNKWRVYYMILPYSRWI